MPFTHFGHDDSQKTGNADDSSAKAIMAKQTASKTQTAQRKKAERQTPRHAWENNEFKHR